MCVFLFFFFKQRTAYGVRISDWSSDVCSSDLAANPPASPAAAPTVHLALSGEGLTFVTPSGSTRHLLFGEPADQVIEAASRAQGSQPERAHNDECGAGPLDMATWPTGLTLVTQGDRFAGWSLSPEAGAGMDDGLEIGRAPV